MKIYKISQDINNDYDTFDSAIVCANNMEEAKRIHPNNIFYDEKENKFVSSDGYCDRNDDTWTNDLDKIKVEYIGEAGERIKKGVIIASFNAG